MPPKHPDDRVRRNLPEPTTRLPSEGSGIAPPKPPRNLTARSRRWWATVWASPMAAVWLAADTPALERLAVLLDRREPGSKYGAGPASELAEIRNLEDRFGLTPLARRRLQWELEHAQAGAAAAAILAEERAARDSQSPAAAGTSAAAGDPDDPERFSRAAGLRAVRGGAA